MKDARIGLYLGINSIGAAVVQGKNIVSLTQAKLSSVDEASVEDSKEELRWEALINKTLREVNAEDKKVYLSLADKDFIVRTLDMPLMKTKEIESSLSFEIEKYIPFKVEELMWDYGHTRFPKEKKMSVSFIGIKESDLKRVEDILSRLELKSVIVEPSCLSLVRVVKSVKNFSQLKNFAILDFTDTEGYLTFFQNDLPVFNRYIKIPAKDGGVDLDNFIESVNFSFQYFKREFKSYQLEKFIIIGDLETDKIASSLKEEIQGEIAVLSSQELTSKNNAGIESAKALGAANIDYLPYKFKPRLKTAKKPIDVIEEDDKVPVNIAFRWGLLGVIAGSGLILTLLFYAWIDGEIKGKQDALKRRAASIEKKVPVNFAGTTWEKREEMVKKKSDRTKVLKKLKSSLKALCPFLDKLAERSTLPQGLWVKNLSILKKQKGYAASLGGSVFLDNDYQERLKLDDFILKLQKDKDIKSIFGKVNLESSTRKKEGEFVVTDFQIQLVK